jgi:hypothetical protein
MRNKKSCLTVVVLMARGNGIAGKGKMRGPE